MSEAERKKRLSYKENRKKWIFIQGVALIIVAVLIFASLIVYSQLNKESYINYTESSGVDYKVKIKTDTPFYEEYKDYYANENGEVWLKSGEAYPSTAVDIIIADVNYELNMEARDVDYEYSYSVFATAEVVDSVTGKKFNMPVVDIKAKSTHRQNSNNKLFINEQIPVDYNAYNEMVNKFTKQLGITKTTSTLIVTMQVNVVGSSDDFASNSQNSHSVNINVPLTEQSFKVDYSSSISSGESKVLAYNNAGNQRFYKGVAITLGAVELLLFIAFILFVYLTRNHDVNYSIKVQRLVNNYRSFIQRVVNGFDTMGYQILEIASFREMLAIRDTIQSPILMSENTDQTRTQFFIPTNTKLLYIFEIKVDNYDELYGGHPDWVDDSLVKLDSLRNKQEMSDSEKPEEVIDTEDNCAPEADSQARIISDLYAEIERLRREIAESTTYTEQESPNAEDASLPKSAEENVSAETSHETEHADLNLIIDELEYDEETEDFVDREGRHFNIPCRRSFTANLIQSDAETVKYYYSELKNYALSFKTVKSRISWRYETFKRGRAQLLRMKLRGKSICIYFALDPAQFDKNKYFHEAVDSKMFDGVPMLVKVKSDRGLKRALELIDAVMSKFGIDKNLKAQKTDYAAQYPFEKTGALIEKGLIKILDDGYHYESAEPKNPEYDTNVTAEEVTDGENSSEIEMVFGAETSDGPVRAEDLEGVEFNSEGEIVIPSGTKLNIHCRRSFAANLMQSNPETVKCYYNEIKNYILSYKGIKARMSWRYESYKKGRNQLFRVRIKGKTLCLYCALDPAQVNESRYYHSVAAAKDYAEVPTVVKIKSERGLKRAKELVDAVMARFDVHTNPKAKITDYLEAYPFRKTRELVEMGYVKILSDSYKIKEPKAPKKSAFEKTAQKNTADKK